VRFYEILLEGRDAPLYHGMTPSKAISVFSSDRIPARWKHNIPGMGEVMGNSLSRNKFLKYGYVILTIDQAKLSHTHKIIPLDAQQVHAHTKGLPTTLQGARDRNLVDYEGQKKSSKDAMAEEFVIGDIISLHRYVTGINIAEPRYGSVMLNKKTLKSLIDSCNEYANKWNIPFSVDKNIRIGR